MLPELTRNIRTALPGVLIVRGGPHASAMGAALLRQTSADIVVTGEGELTFEQVLSAHRDGGGFEGIPGLIWRSRDGGGVTNAGTMPFIEDLDALPFPAYDLIDVRKYGRLWGLSITPPPRRYLTMFTSRGCPYRCSYCHNLQGKRFRAHSPERVVEEMSHYIRTFGVDEFEFVDDVFNFDRDRVLRISDLVRQKGVRCRSSFPNGVRGDILTQEVVDALVAMGTYSSAFALESGSPRIQEAIGKRLSIPRYLEGVSMAADSGIFTSGFHIFGFPTETEDEMRQTIEVAHSSALHVAWFFRLTPYPNTAIYDDAMKTVPEKRAQIDYADTNFSLCPAVNLSAVPDDVVAELLRKGRRRFYLNPRRFVRILRDFPGRSRLVYYLPDLYRGLTARILPKAGRIARKVPIGHVPDDVPNRRGRR